MKSQRQIKPNCAYWSHGCQPVMKELLPGRWRTESVRLSGECMAVTLSLFFHFFFLLKTIWILEIIYHQIGGI